MPKLSKVEQIREILINTYAKKCVPRCPDVEVCINDCYLCIAQQIADIDHKQGVVVEIFREIENHLSKEVIPDSFGEHYSYLARTEWWQSIKARYKEKGN